MTESILPGLYRIPVPLPGNPLKELNAYLLRGNERSILIDTGFRQVVTYYPKPGVVKDVVFFIAVPSGGEEQAQLEEIAEIGWFTFQEACPLVTFASDEEVLLAAERYLEGKRRT